MGLGSLIIVGGWKQNILAINLASQAQTP